MRSKYSPLFDHLLTLKDKRWQTSFREIERMLGFSLPTSARNYPAWWSNNVSTHSHTKAWVQAGWRTANLNLSGETILFIRVASWSEVGLNHKVGNTKFDVGNNQRVRISATTAAPSLSVVANSKTHDASTIEGSFGWNHIGQVNLDGNGRLLFPRAPGSAGLYRFRVVASGQPSVYVGETDNLPRRFAHYRNPGPTQRTNIWLNQLLREAIERNKTVKVDVVVGRVQIRVNGTKTKEYLNDKVVRRMLESMAIFSQRTKGILILNRL